MNFSRFHSLPAAELSTVFEHLPKVDDPEDVAAIAALFENRALVLIRSGSSTELRDESVALNRFVYSKAGRQMEPRHHELIAQLKTVADMLARAAERTDPTFVSAVLSSHKKYAQRVVEFLWRAGEPVARQELLKELDLEESHLSHMLRDLEDADVVTRLRSPGTKEVRIALAPVGRELVRRQYIPDWFRWAMDRIADAIKGLTPEAPARIEHQLAELRAPSRLIADHVNSLVSLASHRGTGARSEAREQASPAIR